MQLQSKGDSVYSPVEREEQILRILESSQMSVVGNQELADRLNVSIATIRRDLRRLEDLGKVSRAYGGVSLVASAKQLEMMRRECHAMREKNAIARAAAARVHDGDLVVLDAGSTAERIAGEIGRSKHVTVVTNGIRSINRLLTCENVQVLVLGGYLRGANGTICGGEAEDMIGRVHGDVAFLGAVRVSPSRGIASLTYDQARLKSLMMRQARQVCVVADASKFGMDDDYPFWSPFPAHWTLISNEGADSRFLDELRQHSGVDEVVLVQPI